MVEVKDSGNSWKNRKKDQACLYPTKAGMATRFFATTFFTIPVGDTALCPVLLIQP